MKLRNKKTGEITNSNELLTDEFIKDLFSKDFNYFESKLDKLQEDWEDDIEDERENDNELTYWYIDSDGDILFTDLDGELMWEMLANGRKEIGNYFKTEEEAKRAADKVKAWKRLKDANIDYKLTCEYDDSTETMYANVSFSFNSYPLVGKDLVLLFGGEE